MSGVHISVESKFLDDQSDPAEPRFVWSYTVSIRNDRPGAVRLMTRHWIITDARGVTQVVRGDGVVGAQPVLGPGVTFRYTSGCPLPTPSGLMRGSYGMLDENGAAFDAPIPAFSLDSPHERRVVN